jgi:hypothetical protein
MKKIILVALILISSNLFGQLVEKQKKITDSIVLAIDKEANENIVAFKIQALQKRLNYIHYKYQAKSGKIIKIACHFANHNDSIQQVFYFKNNELIYSTEGITSFFPDKNGRDSSYWGGTYYFLKNKLIDFVTLGHGKSESDNPNAWDPKREVLNNCQTAKADILRNNKRKKNGG